MFEVKFCGMSTTEDAYTSLNGITYYCKLEGVVDKYSIACSAAAMMKKHGIASNIQEHDVRKRLGNPKVMLLGMHAEPFSENLFLGVGRRSIL